MSTSSPSLEIGSLARVFDAWWRDLTDFDNDGSAKDRAALARLRRIGLGTDNHPDVISALGERAFRDLYRRVERVEARRRLDDPRSDALDDLVIAAVALAGVTNLSEERHTARRLAGDDPDKPRMGDSRFRALMRAKTARELFDHARRIPSLLGGAAPVGDFGASLFLWRVSPRVRRDWARHYYGLDQRDPIDERRTTTPDLDESESTGD